MIPDDFMDLMERRDIFRYEDARAATEAQTKTLSQHQLEYLDPTSGKNTFLAALTLSEAAAKGITEKDTTEMRIKA